MMRLLNAKSFLGEYFRPNSQLLFVLVRRKCTFAYDCDCVYHSIEITNFFIGNVEIGYSQLAKLCTLLTKLSKYTANGFKRSSKNEIYSLLASEAKFYRTSCMLASVRTVNVNIPGVFKVSNLRKML